MMPGLLFIFEGPDGVGKSSTISAVSEHLKGLCIHHSVLSFPGRERGTLGKVIYEIHHNAAGLGIDEMSVTAKQALHIAAHLDAIERQIIPRIEKGEHILLDRFWWSTWVYGVVGGVNSKLLGALIEAERIKWGSLKPALALLLDRDQPINRDEEMDHWHQIRQEYLMLVQREGEFYPTSIVRNTSEPQDTVNDVLRLLSCNGLRM